jgi:hypothetical protein
MSASTLTTAPAQKLIAAGANVADVMSLIGSAYSDGGNKVLALLRDDIAKLKEGER